MRVFIRGLFCLGLILPTAVFAQSSNFYLELRGSSGNFLVGDQSVFHDSTTASVSVVRNTSSSKEYVITPRDTLSYSANMPQRFKFRLRIENGGSTILPGQFSAVRNILNTNGNPYFSLGAHSRGCGQVTDYDIREIGSNKIAVDFVNYCTSDSSKSSPIHGKFVLNVAGEVPSKINTNFYGHSSRNYIDPSTGEESPWFLPEKALDNNHWSYWIGEENPEICISGRPCYRRHQSWYFFAYATDHVNRTLAYSNLKYYSQHYSPDQLYSIYATKLGAWTNLNTNVFKRNYYRTGSLARVDMDGTEGTGLFTYQYGDQRFPVIRELEVFEYTPNRRWQNQFIEYDVNADGFVDEGDAEAVIAELNRNGARKLSVNRPVGRNYVDVSGDEHVTALDALRVINQLPFVPWHNENNRCDTSGDGRVSAIDRLVLINAQNGPLMNTRLKAYKPANAKFYDVNGDGYFTPLDLLVHANNCL